MSQVQHNKNPITNCHFINCKEPFINDEIYECFLNHPPLETMQNPVTIQNIQVHQFEDLELNRLRQTNPLKYPIKVIQDRHLICYRQNEIDPDNKWKIALPASLVNDTIYWYHVTLGHCGYQRLYETIRTHFAAPNLFQRCEAFRCENCQKNKLIGPGYGLLPPRHAPLTPWSEVMVDLVGPWKVKIDQNDDVYFNALTCIDPVSNLVEMIRIQNKTSAHVTQQFENCWLNKYPRPNKRIHDNGGEFIAWEFVQKLNQCRIQDSPTTSYNPQANAICERLHQTVANILRTLLDQHPPRNVQEAEQILDNALSTAVHVTRCATSRSLGISPGALTFHRDMILDLPIIADLHNIQNRRQVLIDENLRRQNQKRRDYNYDIGQELLVKAIKPSKLEPRAHGPYRIERIYTNGTVDILRRNHVLERINIRRIIPFRR